MMVHSFPKPIRIDRNPLGLRLGQQKKSTAGARGESQGENADKYGATDDNTLGFLCSIKVFSDRPALAVTFFSILILPLSVQVPRIIGMVLRSRGSNHSQS